MFSSEEQNLEDTGFTLDILNDDTLKYPELLQNITAGGTALSHGNIWQARRSLAAAAACLPPSVKTKIDIPEPFSARRSSGKKAAKAAVKAIDMLKRSYFALLNNLKYAADESDDQNNNAAALKNIQATLQNIQADIMQFISVVSWENISVILPAYNEEAILEETIQQVLDASGIFCPNMEIIIVDDGSKDLTGEIAEKLMLQDATVTALHNSPNKGYGGALLTGFAGAHGDLLFFMDSDGQFDIHEIAIFLKLHIRYTNAAIIGFRAPRRDPVMRKLNAWGWKQAAKVVIGLRGIRDIDCAFKLFPTTVIRKCGVESQGATINAEMLRKIQKMNIPIFQIPVTHLPRTKGSPTGAKISVIIRAFKELLALRKKIQQFR